MVSATVAPPATSNRVFGDRFIVNAAGIEYHARIAAKVDAATDPLNIRGTTGFY